MPLTVAVTGPTGTLGFGLLPLLEADNRVSRVVGVARRPFDPARHGWTKMEYHRGDVRDAHTLEKAFGGVQVVVHLAFVVVGEGREAAHATNLEGTLNAFRAATAAGASRFVHASSVAAYGFHPDNPVGIREDWPTRPADHLGYARDKAELEESLRALADSRPGPALYLLRPCIVLGPHAVGAKSPLRPLAALGRRVQGPLGRLPIPVPVLVPDVPLQFVHEEDVGRALLQCVVAAGPPGAYNIAGDGVLSVVDVAREVGLLAIPVPARPSRTAARTLARLPFLPASAAWLEVLSQPALMDTTRARTKLAWEPRFSGLEALRDALRG